MRLRHHHPFLEPHFDEVFIPFAHRGGSKRIPENSLAAFAAARELGFRYLETDVQLTSDGVLVAFHDANLSRTCGVDRDIQAMTAAELSSERIAGLEPIPLLTELFEHIPDAMINIDTKSDATVEPLIAFLRRTKSLHRVCVGSFSHRRLQRIRAAFGRDVCTSASPVEVSRWLLGIPIAGPSCVQIPQAQYGLRLAAQRRIERSSRFGLPVHIWTVDDPGQMQRLIDIGVHGIMTDDGVVLRDVARRNGIWQADRS